jgi:predicted flap endonuclease-1-like 5' DNA nuclease
MTFRMRWPTQYDRLTQAFGVRPEFYKKFGLPGHEGLDFQAPEGSEIYAVADGFVSDVRLDGNADPAHKPYGNQVRVQHEGGFTTVYAHLSNVVVSQGQAVQAGQLVGLSGNTGNSFGAHLHLTLKKEGATSSGETDYPYDIVDPTPYLEPFDGGEGAEPDPPAEPFMQVKVHSPEVGYLNVRRAPYVGSEQVGRVDHGTLLGSLEESKITESKVGEEGQWLWVRLPNGDVGYVAAWYLALPEEEEAPVPAPGEELHVVVDSPNLPLKLREGPGTEHEKVGEMPHGTVLTALEPEDAVRRKLGDYGAWLWVRTPDGKEGYTAAWYLDWPEEAPAPSPVLLVVVESPEVPLKLREGPGIEHAKIGEMADGTVLKALEPEADVRRKVGAQGAWLRVQTPGGQTGYTAAWYLVLKSEIQPEPEPTPTTGPVTHVFVESPEFGLRVRSGPGTDHAQVGWVPHGTVLTSLEDPRTTGEKVGQQDAWLHVRAPSRREGYVAAWYVRRPDSKDERKPAKDSALPMTISPHIFGMHAAQLSDDHYTRDPIRNLFQSQGKRGWTFFTEVVARRPGDVRLNPDIRNRLWDWAEQDYGVIVRLNHGYHPGGTLPESQYYDEFAEACGRWAQLYLKRDDLDPEAYTWTIQIANEMNNPSEHPGGLHNPKEHITPELYAEAFNKIYAHIKAVLPNAVVCPGAVDPYNSSPMPLLGNVRWRPLDYFQTMLDNINALDGFILHAYTHGPSVEAVTHLVTFGDPFLSDHYFDFQTYRQFMERIPARWKELPVYITETNHVCRADNAPACDNPASQGWTNANIGWVRAAYEEIDRWNNQPYAQQIRALLLYRWTGDQWRIDNKGGIQEDFKQAMQRDYRWRKPPTEVTAAGAISFAAPTPEAAPAENVEERTLVLPDDLTLIWSLGPKSAKLLRAAGIVVFEQLAALQPEQIRRILREAGIRVRYVETWPEQARYLVEGNDAALVALQERMRHGRLKWV